MRVHAVAWAGRRASRWRPQLVTGAWEKAREARRPGPGLLHHSDRGVQYASGAMAALLSTKAGPSPSMSRRGNCYDNAIMESFWATLKTECFAGERHRRPDRPPDSKSSITSKAFYNRRRLHSSLGYQIPAGVRANVQLQPKLKPHQQQRKSQSTLSKKDQTVTTLVAGKECAAPAGKP